MFALQSLQNYLAFHPRRHLRKQPILDGPTIHQQSCISQYLCSFQPWKENPSYRPACMQGPVLDENNFYLFSSSSLSQNEFCTLDLELGKYLPQTVQFGLQYPVQGKATGGEVFRRGTLVICRTYQQEQFHKELHRIQSPSFVCELPNVLFLATS